MILKVSQGVVTVVTPPRLCRSQVRPTRRHPIIKITTSTDSAPEPREPLFSIDDTEYTVPVEVRATMALEAMERTRTQGEPAATAWLMAELLGEEGWRALRTSRAVSKADLRTIMEICRQKVFGVLEEEGKG